MSGSWDLWNKAGIPVFALGVLVCACRRSSEKPPPAPPQAQAGNLTSLPPVEVAAMVHTCAGCHGRDGQAQVSAFPPLAGMPAEQFVRAMHDFRTGRRPATLMGLVARGFTDRDDQAMGDYFAEVAPQPLPGERP